MTQLCIQGQILQVYIISLLDSQGLKAKTWQHLKQNTCDFKHSRYKALQPLNITSALFMIRKFKFIIFCLKTAE